MGIFNFFTMIPIYICTKCFGINDFTKHLAFEIESKWFAISHNHRNNLKFVIVSTDYFYFDRTLRGKSQKVIKIFKPTIIHNTEIKIDHCIKDVLKLKMLL